jgi:hypothetical protein
MGWEYRTHEALRDTWRIVVRKQKSKMDVCRFGMNGTIILKWFFKKMRRLGMASDDSG